MITEDYCSYELAKLLKEKGFDEKCRTRYCTDGRFDISLFHYKNSEINEDAYNAPTHQMAMKYLREVHNRFIEVCADKGHDFKDIVFRPTVYDKDLDYLWESDNYKSYEEAVEAALKYSLENLI